jgi:hypothetical protein
MVSKKGTDKYDNEFRRKLDADGKIYLRELSKLRKPHLKEYADLNDIEGYENMKMNEIQDCILEDYLKVRGEDKKTMWTYLKSEVQRQREEKQRQKVEKKKGKPRETRTPCSSEIPIAKTVHEIFARAEAELIEKLRVDH